MLQATGRSPLLMSMELRPIRAKCPNSTMEPKASHPDSVSWKQVPVLLLQPQYQPLYLRVNGIFWKAYADLDPATYIETLYTD
ncbi:hypothetical protein AVEN_229206-1 [Araneus ventricosus]|uniref:Uncharacterized protein n=1 Tax=Araneus ventricosus TaxID=182803 RepID=A0A4Y2X1G8_ARAVE|nr:hypothetical protein AVEN_229206-1 [Araneus ventricosus]